MRRAMPTMRGRQCEAGRRLGPALSAATQAAPLSIAPALRRVGRGDCAGVHTHGHGRPRAVMSRPAQWVKRSSRLSSRIGSVDHSTIDVGGLQYAVSGLQL
mmetsp:Transcript_10525/g.27996  ORF Transcript_10525/g.27996 Transcript_10525/m.27996 type:complete len:101 (-) Transcript_10525:35-337(-)